KECKHENKSGKCGYSHICSRTRPVSRNRADGNSTQWKIQCRKIIFHQCSGRKEEYHKDFFEAGKDPDAQLLCYGCEVRVCGRTELRLCKEMKESTRKIVGDNRILTHR